MGRFREDDARPSTKASFPTEEVVDDSVVRRRQIEVISLINEEAKGWVVPESVLNPPDVLENVSWDDESMSGVRSSLESVRSEVRAKMERNKERRSMRRSRQLADKLPVGGVDDDQRRVARVGVSRVF